MAHLTSYASPKIVYNIKTFLDFLVLYQNVSLEGNVEYQLLVQQQ